MKGRSALRKCMFMQMPPHLRALAAALPKPSPIQAWRPIREEAPINLQVRNPAKDARMMPAVRPHDVRAWWEDPLALGALLVFAPPVGLACVWTSKLYSNDARWALTVISTLLTALAGALTLALVLR